MIALGRALAARGHDVTLQTWTRWQEHVEAEGLTFAPAPEYQVFPSRPRAAGLLRGRRPGGRGHPAARARAAARRRRRRHPHARPGARRRARGTFPARRSSPTSTRPANRTSRSTRSAPACPAPRSAARSGAAPSARSRGASSVGRVELNDTRARLGLPAARARPRRHQPRAGDRRRRSRSSSTRAPGPPHVHVVGPLMWEPPADDVELPPGDAPLVLVAPSTAQDPEHRMLTAALRGLADAPVRVLATWNRRLPPASAAGARERARRRLGLLLAHDAPLRRRRLPRRPRHARARPGLAAAPSSPARPSAT